MNKKLLLGFVGVFVVVFVLEFIINNYLMMSIYEQTAGLWRPPEEMKMWLVIICQLFFAFFFTFIFSKGYEGKGIGEGIRYGLYVTGLMTIPAAYVSYATMPVPYSLALGWFLYGTVENVVAGSVAALVFGKKETPKAPAS